MDPLWIACRHARDFPLHGTLLDPALFEHHLKSYDAKLNERAKSLFSPDQHTDVKLLETDSTAQGPWKWRSKTINSYDEMKSHLGVTDAGLSNDNAPTARFVFIWADSSRDPLWCSRQVLLLLLTYHQVMPDFLDFLFPFGLQQYLQDAPFNDFRVQCRLTENERGIGLPALRHSGLNYKMCYGMKGVESTNSPEGPWSIRQASLYHCFDVETGTADWILVKGNLLLQRRLERMTKSGVAIKGAGLQTLTEKFVASLESHLWVCDWAGEHWRWYLNYLEEEFQQLSRQIYAVPVPEHDRESLQPTKSLLKAFTWNKNESRNALPNSIDASGNGAPLPQPVPSMNPPMSPPVHRPAVDGAPIPLNEKITRQETPSPRPTKVFKFEDYMRLQYIKDKADEAQLILESNASIIRRLYNHYESVIRNPEWPTALRNEAKPNIVAFLAKMTTAETHMSLQRSRAQLLLRTLENRTSILNGILEYENTQETIKSTLSAERLTEEMHKVALRTARQTALMLLIALVTVVYLPATFISTLMSTDIVNWSKGKNGRSVKTFQWPALQMFLYVSLPLTVITLAACGVYYWIYVRMEKRSKLLAGPGQV